VCDLKHLDHVTHTVDAIICYALLYGSKVDESYKQQGPALELLNLLH
jgi:hypothetical protein